MTVNYNITKNTYKKSAVQAVHIKDTAEMLLCISSLFTADGNAHLLILPVVFLLLCREKAGRYICAVALTVYFGINVATNSFYIPYMTFVFIYIIADFLLPDKRKTAVVAAALTFAAVKIYVLSFGFSTLYWAVLGLETAAVFLLPDAAEGGKELLCGCADIEKPIQLCECCAALAVTALALGGIKIWGVDVPLCFLVSLCFFYGAMDNMVLSILSVILAVFTQYNSPHFHLVFVGFILVGFASFALMQKGYCGYFCTFAVALGITLAFMTQFNSFVFATTTSVALAVCFVLSKKCRPVCKKCQLTETAGESDYLRLMNSVDRLGRTFRFLGNTIIDISGLMAEDEAPKELQSVAAEQVCRKCRNSHICWQQNFDHTQKQFSAFEHAMKKGEDFSFDQLFLSRCDKTEQLYHSFTSAHRLLSAQKLINKAGVHNRRILQNQFFTMAQTLQDIVYHSNRSGIANTAFTHTVNSFLLSMGKRVNYCICFQNKAVCIINTADYFSHSELGRIRQKLESVYGIEFNVPSKEDDGDGVVYTFREKAVFGVEYACASKGRYHVCGDVCEEFGAEGYHYVILADGMGTGGFAAAESRTAVCMLKSLLTAGINPETAIDITNIAINLKGTGQSCVAVDILRINCADGSSALYKAGGAATLVVSAGRCKKMYRDSLPVGILKDTKVAKLEFSLKNGDAVVMMSDGVKEEKSLAEKLCLMAEKTAPQQMAEYIISKQNSGDDITAAVIKLTRV